MNLIPYFGLIIPGSIILYILQLFCPGNLDYHRIKTHPTMIASSVLYSFAIVGYGLLAVACFLREWTIAGTIFEIITLFILSGTINLLFENEKDSDSY